MELELYVGGEVETRGYVLMLYNVISTATLGSISIQQHSRSV